MSQDFHEPASHAPEPPTVAEDRDAKRAQRETIAALFNSRPLEEITPMELRKITPHYQQRISELRRQKDGPMRIVNVPQWVLRPDGSKAKQDGNYRFEPIPVNLGPSSDRYRAQPRLI